MIKYITGNIFESQSEALVNTVNTVGIMGKGIALQFKNQFSSNYREYVKACKSGALQVGQLLVVEDISLHYGKKTIINFPTKTDWRKPSEYDYIEKGLINLVQIIKENKIQSIAIPPLGAGNGGLEWYKVKELLEKYLSDLDCTIDIYEPNAEVKEVLKKERVGLTPARAMLLAVLYDLVRNGEFVSEFASEKIGYFLQRFGAKDLFKLDYQANFYGPYSGKIKHVLYYLNGSYISGYSSKDKKPFEELNLMMDAEQDVLAYLSKEAYQNEMQIVHKTQQFLTGFYSNFGLELLSTLDFIIQQEQTTELPKIKQKLSEWSNRKTKLFSNDAFIEKGLAKLERAQLINSVEQPQIS
jgi:O-acetyl-ADP-ribose deacetylase (regulator of RNase III)